MTVMQDFEKLGAFYIGKRVDTETDKLTDEFVLYDAKDLTTHAVIIGMTGSGKTGLGVVLVEEADIVTALLAPGGQQRMAVQVQRVLVQVLGDLAPPAP